MISVLNQLSRQGQAVSGRASRFEAPVSSFRTIGASQPVSSPTSPHQDKAATPARQPSLLSQMGRGLGTPADMDDSGIGAAVTGIGLRGPQNAFESQVGRDIMSRLAGVGTSGLMRGLVSGGLTKYAGAPSSVSMEAGVRSIMPNPISALRAIADTARLGYAQDRINAMFADSPVAPEAQYAEFQEAKKTPYDLVEAFSPQQQLENAMTDQRMVSYNEEKTWGNTAKALGRDILSILSGKPFTFTPLTPGQIKMSDIMSRGDSEMDPNQSIGGISPQDRLDALGGPPTPENPDRAQGGWGWGDVGGAGSVGGGFGGQFGDASANEGYGGHSIY